MKRLFIAIIPALLIYLLTAETLTAKPPDARIGNNFLVYGGTLSGSDLFMGLEFDYDWNNYGYIEKHKLDIRIYSLHEIGAGTRTDNSAIGVRLREGFGVQVARATTFYDLHVSLGYLPLDANLSNTAIYFGSSLALGVHGEDFSLHYERGGHGFATGFIIASEENSSIVNSLFVRYKLPRRHMKIQAKIVESYGQMNMFAGACLFF